MATALFAGHGFDQVTIAQVAEAAGVSKMTVTNYFPRKEDLVCDRAGHIIGGLAQVVRAGGRARACWTRPAGTTPGRWPARRHARRGRPRFAAMVAAARC